MRRRTVKLLLLFFLGTPPCWAAIARVNDTTATGSGASTTIAAAAANHTTGNLLVVKLKWETNVALSSVTDTAGNTYTLLPRQGTTLSVQMAYSCNITGNVSNVVTATWATSVTWRVSSVTQYSGIAASACFDVQTTASGTGTAVDAGNVTTTVADEVIVVVATDANSTTWTAATNFTIINSGLGGDTGTEDRIVASTGTYATPITKNQTNTWQAAAATFKGVGGAPPPAPNRLTLLGVGAALLHIFGGIL